MLHSRAFDTSVLSFRSASISSPKLTPSLVVAMANLSFNRAMCFWESLILCCNVRSFTIFSGEERYRLFVQLCGSFVSSFLATALFRLLRWDEHCVHLSLSAVGSNKEHCVCRTVGNGSPRVSRKAINSFPKCTKSSYHRYALMNCI